MLFTRLPFAVSSGSLPVIPADDVESLVPYEDAYDHWIFDKGDATGLTGRINGKLLTLQANAPTYSAKHVSLPAAAGNALLTDRPDAVDSVDTVCAVVRLSVASGIQTPIGTLDAGSGGGPFFSGAAPRRVFSSYRHGVASLEIANPVADGGVWYFVSVSRNFAGAAKSLIHLIGGFAAVAAAPGTYTPRAGGNVAMGNAYYASAAVGTMDFGEFIYFDRALSAAELQAVYERSKERMTASGIVVH